MQKPTNPTVLIVVLVVRFCQTRNRLLDQRQHHRHRFLEQQVALNPFNQQMLKNQSNLPYEILQFYFISIIILILFI